MKRLRGAAVLAALGAALALAGCGAGSGRSGTDLAVSGTLETPALNGGDPVTFTMTVSNRGDFDARDVLVRNATLQLSPAALQIDCTASGGATCPDVTGASMEIPVLPSGGSLAFVVRSALVIGASGSFSNTMVVSSETADVNAANNSVTLSGTASSHDVAVVGTAPAAPLVTTAAVFSMQVSNAGPDAASAVVLAATVSDNLVFLPADLACVATGGAALPVLQPDDTWQVDVMPAGAALECDLPVSVAAGTNGVAAVSLTATAAGDARAGNNTATASVSATLVNDVSVTGTAPAGPLVDGPATFTMVVANAGPAVAQDVRLTTAISASVSLTPASISCTTAGGATAPTLQPDDSLLVASLPAGSQLGCSLPVMVAAGTNGIAAVSMTAATAHDIRPGNDSATASVSATLVNDLNVAGSAAAASVPGGGNTVFTLVINNSGPSTAYDVSLSNTLGSGLSLSGAITCAAAGGAQVPVATAGGALVSAAVPVGGVLTCTVPVTVAAGASGVVFTTFNASAAGETRPADNSATVTTVAVSANLGVSQSAAVQAPAGGPLSFTARVNNPGPSAASNLQITWSSVAPAGVVFDAPTCTPVAGATCPAVLGPAMSVPSLAPGRTLVFTFNATSVDSVRGDVVSTVAVTADEDIDPSNNSASATTTIVDARNGSYDVFAADGRAYLLSIDFDAGQYTLSGNGVSTQRQFIADGGGFTVAGTARLRVATDLIVGGHDFGAGALPFVAARSFATNVQALAGTYNLFSRRVATNGTATTVPATAFVSGNTLSICESETAPVLPVRLCGAGNRTDFVNLTAAGDLFTGTSAAGESFSFKLASSGAAKILLAAGTMPDLRQRLRIGLVDATGGVTFGPPQQGPTSAGDWAQTSLVDGNPVVWSSIGVQSSDSAQMGSVSNGGGGPFSMLAGTSTAAGGTIYLMQAFPLTVVIGGNPFSSPASGLLQISLP